MWTCGFISGRGATHERPVSTRAGAARRTALTGLVCLVVVLGAGREWHAARSARRAAEGLARRAAAMQADAAAIERLRAAPRLASEEARPNDDLMDEIREALEQAGVEAARWTRTDPGTAARLPKTPYLRLDTRLSLEGVSMRQTAAFVAALAAGNSALRATQLRLRAAGDEAEDIWHADVTISYLIYAPQP